jgi:predicted phosphoribosyltransferase
VLALALSRGGVPVALWAAKALDVSFDVFLVRKLGVPGQGELATGAIATGAFPEASSPPRRPGSSKRWRAPESLPWRPPESVVRVRIAIVVDDGLVTGATMPAAATALRQRQPARLVVAVPATPARDLRGDKPASQARLNGTTEALEKGDYYDLGHWAFVYR